jgi:carbohydrate diacid regulator
MISLGILELIQKRLSIEVRNSMPSFFDITGKMGSSLINEDAIYRSAKKAASTKKPVKDSKGVWWIPLCYNNQLVSVCGIRSRGTAKTEERLLIGLLNEIAHEAFLEEKTSEMIDPKSNFVHELLEKEYIKTLSEAIDRGDILGINLRAKQAVMIIKAPGILTSNHNKKQGESAAIASAKDCARITSLFESAFEFHDQNVFACIEGDTFVCLKWAQGEVNTTNSISFFRKKAKYLCDFIREKTGITPTISVGQYYPGISGLRKSYSDAKVAMEIGEGIWGTGGVYHIVDIGMFISLSQNLDFERKCELAFQILGPILTDEAMYKTVSVFLDNDMNLTTAAKKLHLHRNTLIYRLDKVKKEIGLDPRNFSDAIQLKLGLVLYGPSIRCQID